jgi:hypothetical protein
VISFLLEVHISKNERLLRQKEWNDGVDEYITSNRAEGDTRTIREIEEVAKIGMDGASLYKACSYCITKEQREGEFALCSRCKMRAYLREGLPAASLEGGA